MNPSQTRAPEIACAGDTTQPPWVSDEQPGYGPGASMLDVIPVDAPRQGGLPAEYRDATDAELDERIRAAKAALGERVLVLGHFYQRDDVIQHADVVGDSYRLACAARERGADTTIVFCGVHFMAETADVLTEPNQAVLLPNLAAGCSMADMADRPSVERAWRELADVLGDLDPLVSDATDSATPLLPIVPVTYMNSAAALKAFCGEHGGIVCTSSNATAVLEWAFERGERVLFFPDQHLGRNTALALGIPRQQIVTWNPNRPLGGNTAEQLREAKVIVWHGFCSVHRRFTVEQIAQARRDYPDVHVIVHPECSAEVVAQSDEVGSTEVIVRAVRAAEPGQVIAIGTEINLVRRLAAERPDLTVFCLDPIVCPCSTMYRIHPGYLAWVLEELVAGRVMNRVQVPADMLAPAQLALERMLAARPEAARSLRPVALGGSA